VRGRLKRPAGIKVSIADCGRTGFSAHPGIAFPDAPHFFFIRRLGVIGGIGGRQRAAGPTELDPLLRRPALENGVQDPAHKPVAAPDAVQDGDLTRLDHVPVLALGQDGAPQMGVGADHLPQGRAENAGVGIGLAHPVNHGLETFYFRRQPLPPVSGPSMSRHSWKSSSFPARTSATPAISAKMACSSFWRPFQNDAR